MLNEDLDDRVRLRAAEVQEARRAADLSHDRERIAADIHDLAIQRLYAVALTLDSSSRSGDRTTIDGVIDTIDDVVAELRGTIHNLRKPLGTATLSTTLGEIADIGLEHGFSTDVRVSGDVDSLPVAVGVHLGAVLREAVSNALRHSGGDSVSISLAATTDDVSLVVADNGQRAAGRRRPLQLRPAQHPRARRGDRRPGHLGAQHPERHHRRLARAAERPHRTHLARVGRPAPARRHHRRAGAAGRLQRRPGPRLPGRRGPDHGPAPRRRHRRRHRRRRRSRPDDPRHVRLPGGPLRQVDQPAGLAHRGGARERLLPQAGPPVDGVGGGCTHGRARTVRAGAARPGRHAGAVLRGQPGPAGAAAARSRTATSSTPRCSPPRWPPPSPSARTRSAGRRAPDDPVRTSGGAARGRLACARRHAAVAVRRRRR